MESRLDTRTCTLCNITYDISEFMTKRTKTKVYISLQCRTCRNEKCREYYKNKKQTVPSYSRSRNLSSKFGITEEKYQSLFEAQGSCCAICGTTEPKTSRSDKFAIDHLHGTKIIRGILCAKCNAGLGFFDEDIDKLMKAIAYLTKAVENGKC